MQNDEIMEECLEDPQFASAVSSDFVQLQNVLSKLSEILGQRREESYMHDLELQTSFSKVANTPQDVQSAIRYLSDASHVTAKAIGILYEHHEEDLLSLVLDTLADASRTGMVGHVPGDAVH